MTDNTPNLGVPVSAKVYPDTLKGLKDEQYRRLQKFGREPSYADLLKEAWDHYMSAQSGAKLEPSHAQGMKTREQRQALAEITALIRLNDPFILQILRLLSQAWENAERGNKINS